MQHQVQQSRQLPRLSVRAAAADGSVTTLIGNGGPSPQAQAAIGQHAHNVTMTALVIALARHFVIGQPRREVDDFLTYFAEQSQRMAAQAAIAGVEQAAAQKTRQLAAMLLDKHIEARREPEQG
jgi:hypothetical protein